jgi:hypothetical protein
VLFKEEETRDGKNKDEAIELRTIYSSIIFVKCHGRV